ncbi:MAG: hypothetical protein ACTHM8_02345 [Sphingomonas sp.]
MIAMVALAATHQHRDRAAALWIGMAIGFSAWALLPAAAVFSAATNRRNVEKTLPMAALMMSVTNLALASLGFPHGLSALGAIPAVMLGLIGAACLIAQKVRWSRAIVPVRRLALLSE